MESAEGLDAAEVLRSTRPPDDSGASTADRYEWQAMVATADVLSLYYPAIVAPGDSEFRSFEVICEHHEDWAVIRGASAEIVSGKHREASIGPFGSLHAILTDGGVLHLFERWLALQRLPRCRLVTSSGLSGAAARLMDVCDHLRAPTSPPRLDEDEVEVTIDEFASAIVHLCQRTNSALSATVRAGDVRSFMTSLWVDGGQARREHFADMASQRYGRPVADRLGHPGMGDAVWEGVLSLVRVRMRAAGASAGGKLPTVLGLAHDPALASRSLTFADVDFAARNALRHPRGYFPLPRLVKANRMAVKMAQGGCSDNAIERADQLRLQYRAFWRVRNGSPMVSDLQRQLSNVLIRVVDETTDSVRFPGASWGADLWRELGSRFAAIRDTPEAQGLSVDLLLGGVSELANLCRAWYSERFDPTEQLVRLRSGSPTTAGASDRPLA